MKQIDRAFWRYVKETNKLDEIYAEIRKHNENSYSNIAIQSDMDLFTIDTLERSARVRPFDVRFAAENRPSKASVKDVIRKAKIKRKYRIKKRKPINIRDIERRLDVGSIYKKIKDVILTQARTLVISRILAIIAIQLSLGPQEGADFTTLAGMVLDFILAVFINK